MKQKKEKNVADKTTGELTAVEQAAIGALPGIADLYDDTLLPVEQQGEARHMTGAQWKKYAQAGVSKYVEDAQKAANDAQEAVAAVGTAVEDAAASAEAAKTSRESAEAARQAIENMEVSADSLSTGQPASVTKTTENGVVHLTFGLPKGAKGTKGDPGSSIQSIVRTDGTGAAGTTDTYTVTLTDGTTSTFQVYNGADGTGSGDMQKNIYDTQNRNTDIFQYVDEKMGNFPAPDDLVTVPGSGAINVPEMLGEGPYTIAFTDEDDPPLTADMVGAPTKAEFNSLKVIVDYPSRVASLDYDGFPSSINNYSASFATGTWLFDYAIGSLRILSNNISVVFFPKATVWPKNTTIAKIGAFDFELRRFDGKTPAATNSSKFAYWIDADGNRTEAEINVSVRPITSNTWGGIEIQLSKDYTKPGCWLCIYLRHQFEVDEGGQ